ncbi:thiaminase II [Nitrospina watsonii]|uniref:Aminopyrimidine aminohydrolase n=1 Tax=Nitrospina watsonii TaxID=1323948 RepID=A0ABM9HDH4_9BACT|nr:thiaminase II [Nitrospina watsonii]CAI2718279.1 Aminopyrimidine aminohydrolase [Nitrospina watsonii]
MSFTQDAWSSITGIYQDILDHPFNKELGEGTLAKERFQFYMKQDSLYLEDFARALAIAASKAPTPDDIVLLLDFAKGAIVAERSLHQFYFDFFEIQLDAEREPGCFTYTKFLLSTASHDSYEVGIAALLPCFWIYREVGLHIHKHAKPGNTYQKWIDMYSSPEFSAVVDQAIDLTDRVADGVSAATRLEMQEAFIKSTQLEWMFWDSAYRLRTWSPESPQSS